MKHKNKAFIKFKEWKGEVERKIEKKLKCWRIDNGGEYQSKTFLEQCKDEGITRHFTISDTPKHSVVERMNTTLLERALEHESGKCYKLESKSKQCIFLDFEKGVKGFKLWDPISEKIVVNRDVAFDESYMVKTDYRSQTDGSTAQVELGEQDTAGQKVSSSNLPEPHETVDDPYTVANGKGKRTHKAFVRYEFEDIRAYALTAGKGGPSSYQDVINDVQSAEWMTGMMEEMESL
ncbi:hypothetical protein NE237_008942 [Protea cynaroides]|uniref:Retroviral polymerase SH3-like domain-containing protein n=1 Tax=Protea cynaroides TaxID=273540 RepID=A0A9Q0R057_9MAGN|nr:hypothetical protein NE237_008942 [Protea cynaroides]